MFDRNKTPLNRGQAYLDECQLQMEATIRYYHCAHPLPNVKRETVEEFLARGGKIQKIDPEVFGAPEFVGLTPVAIKNAQKRKELKERKERNLKLLQGGKK